MITWNAGAMSWTTVGPSSFNLENFSWRRKTFLFRVFCLNDLVHPKRPWGFNEYQSNQKIEQNQNVADALIPAGSSSSSLWPSISVNRSSSSYKPSHTWDMSQNHCFKEFSTFSFSTAPVLTGLASSFLMANLTSKGVAPLLFNIFKNASGGEPENSGITWDPASTQSWWKSHTRL